MNLVKMHEAEEYKIFSPLAYSLLGPIIFISTFFWDTSDEGFTIKKQY